jgi:hypothetical protein
MRVHKSIKNEIVLQKSNIIPLNTSKSIFLENYKKTKINELNAIFNNQVSNYRRILNANISNIQRSRLNNNIKRIQISSLTNQFNNLVNNLRQKLNADIQKVINFKLDFSVGTIKSKKGLLVGINYIGTNYELSGCINDCNLIKSTIEGYNHMLLTEESEIKPTKDNILVQLKNTLETSVEGDLIFFYYSGHGSYTIDRNNDETDMRDEMLIALDLKGILDDELKSLLNSSLKKGVTLIGLFDSCHSGTCLDLRYQYMTNTTLDPFTENTRVTECNGNAILISGCRDNEYSVETMFNSKINGAMTWAFTETLKQNKDITWRQLLENMRNLLKSKRFSQIPQISSDSLIDLDTKIFI